MMWRLQDVAQASPLPTIFLERTWHCRAKLSLPRSYLNAALVREKTKGNDAAESKFARNLVGGAGIATVQTKTIGKKEKAKAMAAL